MTTVECPGLPAEWINGWLAAVGVTVLNPSIKLSWSEGSAPIAVFHHPDKEVSAAVSEVWPDRYRLEDMPLSRDYKGYEPLERQVPLEVFSERVGNSRGHPDAWTLTSTLTDLATDSDKASHAPFDPAGPGSIKWLHHRLLKVYQHIPEGDITSLLVATFNGTSMPVKDNGLGFDISRLPDRAQSGGGLILVDPVIEVLAFFGLALLPVRGDGIRRRQERPKQRGHGIGGRREGVFIWPAWSEPLNRWGIDALLDAWYKTWKFSKVNDSSKWNTSQTDWEKLGVHAGWETKPYRQTASADSTRGFSSERIQLSRSRPRR